MEHRGVLVDGFDVVHGLQRVVQHAGIVVADILERVFHVFGGHGLAVMPHGAFRQVERDGLAICGVIPALGEIGDDVRVGVQLRQSLIDVLRRSVEVIVGQSVGVEAHDVTVHLQHEGIACFRRGFSAFTAASAARACREGTHHQHEDEEQR